MRLNKKENSWFTMIMVVFLVWFMLMLTTWTFNLILTELNDNRWAWSYLNAFAWAEWAQELALLKIKEKWYWIDDDILNQSDSRSIVLSQNPTDNSKFNSARDALISYNLNTKVSSYTWTIAPLSYSIIPLFYINTWAINNIKWVSDITLTSTDISSDIVWNIVWTWAWISWTWVFDKNSNWFKKTVADVSWKTEQSFTTETISTFLWSWWENYLIVLNSGSSTWTFTLKANWTDKDFTRPETDIISTAKVWIYKQNLTTKIDNTEFLNILKYSIFSN